jgi:hypothetical protein
MTIISQQLQTWRRRDSSTSIPPKYMTIMNDDDGSGSSNSKNNNKKYKKQYVLPKVSNHLQIAWRHIWEDVNFQSLPCKTSNLASAIYCFKDIPHRRINWDAKMLMNSEWYCLLLVTSHGVWIGNRICWTPVARIYRFHCIEAHIISSVSSLDVALKFFCFSAHVLTGCSWLATNWLD